MYRNTRSAAYRPARPDTSPRPKHRPGKKTSLVILTAVVLAFVGGTIFFSHNTDKTATGNQPPAGPAQAPQSQPAVNGARTTQNFNKQQHSTTEAASLWGIVNKQHPLSPASYTPADLVVPNVPLRNNITGNEKYLRSDTAKVLEKMASDARKAGVTLNLQSGYRSYDFQVTLYDRYVQSQGRAVADRQSARPGYSEHQTGLAADLGGTTRPECNVEACYADTPEGKWLAANGYKYGFIIRYPADKEPVTGYLYEPWHVRYVGSALATQLHETGIETLEEFFGVTGGTAY